MPCSRTQHTAHTGFKLTTLMESWFQIATAELRASIFWCSWMKMPTCTTNRFYKAFWFFPNILICFSRIHDANISDFFSILIYFFLQLLKYSINIPYLVKMIWKIKLPMTHSELTMLIDLKKKDEEEKKKTQIFEMNILSFNDIFIITYIK